MSVLAWFADLFTAPKVPRRIALGNTCRVCGRKYTNPDSAAICGDWDSVLGRDR